MTDSMDVLGLPRRVAVTGGASGIGLACARLFHESGAGVGIVGRSQGRLDEAAAGLAGGGAVVPVAADVADEDGITGAIDRIAGELGGLDALVLCAGIEGEMGAAVSEVTGAGFREVLEVNVLGAFLAVKAALPHLRQTTGGTITLIGSDSGFVSVPGMLAYNASKGAVVQLVRALAVELYETDRIRVNSVAPSIVDTPMARRGLGDELMDDPNFPLQSPEDVAWTVAYLSSKRARAVNGMTVLSDFGFTGRSSFPA
ncbi:MAG: SDR family oxidoreductase [Microbacterium sp.]|uniref:SDR family NAD(P)-dependent oxidoreductase n=1 Tax=Microbacterium sp. TaxID=51671 RepID=UPI0039E64DC6